MPLGTPYFAVSNGIAAFRVTNSSKRVLRNRVFQMARYFQLEKEYDFIQYSREPEEDEDETNTIAYLYCDTTDQHRDFVPIGATCFRLRFETQRWAMAWIWLHPFKREKGILTNSHAHFLKEFGNYDIEGPYSQGMAAFIAKYPRLQTPGKLGNSSMIST
jgi:hypothetical protein